MGAFDNLRELDLETDYTNSKIDDFYSNNKMEEFQNEYSTFIEDLEQTTEQLMN